MTFDEVLPALVRLCESVPHFDAIERAALVRDLRGNVRLVLDRGRDGHALDLGALSSKLVAALGVWFVPPVLTTSDPKERGTLARAAFDHARPWKPEWLDPATDTRVSAKGAWYLLERRLSKGQWLAPPPLRALWPLRAGNPGIVTFYSFKGGVGRTTALVGCAWQLARRGSRVVVVDLDLEAPGLGMLLDCETDRGVLDFIVDHIGTGATDLRAMLGTARALGDDAERVTVLPAGRLGVGFLEKLGRLDFAGGGLWPQDGESPVELALADLLRRVRRELKPDYILLDSRAGLHDIAGLSLHRLAHVDVLVGRASRQGYEGLALTIEALSKRKRRSEMRTVLLHSMTPPDQTSPEGIAELQEFQKRGWDLFSQHVYGDQADAVGEHAPEAHHIPIPIPFDYALTRFSSLAGIDRVLFGPHYERLRERIEALCAPEDDEDST
ncbi:MAG: AAA family ATPase [Polyangiales bacterium]